MINNTMNINAIPGRASDAGPSLSEDAPDTRDWHELVTEALEAAQFCTSWRSDRDTRQAETSLRRSKIYEAIDLLQMALDRL